jgi:hypothetical protein
MKKILSLVAAVLLASNVSAQDEWIELIANGDCEGTETTNFYSKEYPASAPTNSTIVAEEVGDGAESNHCIKVVSPAKVKDDWDTQFWIVLDELYPEGTTFKVSFDCKASVATSAGTQAHGNPGSYQHWTCGLGDVSFGTEWQTITKTVTIDGSMAGSQGFKSFAFNLSKSQDIDYYFDNISVQLKYEAPIANWSSIINNGDFEGEGNTNFFVKQAALGAGIYAAKIVDGIGIEPTGAPSKGIVIQAADNPTEGWDTQFWIKFDKKIPAGTKLKVSFDYKATYNETANTQSHALPGAYIHYVCIGDVNFETGWKNFAKELTVTADMSKDDNPMQSIAFNLAVSGQFNNFYFDNFVVEVPEDVYANLVDADPFEGDEQVVLPANTINVTLGNEGVKTMSSKHALELPEGLKAYAVVFNEGGWADKVEIESPIAANTPVILEGEAGEYELTIVESGNAPTANDLKISDGKKKGGANVFGLANGNKGVGFYVVSSSVTIPAGKGYLEASANAREFIPFGTTGINAVAAAEQDDVLYNLAGQRVVKAQKGLYIVNGKKVLVK